jgi:CheY-like chemotaxis protein
MNQEPARSISTFATTARQQVRLALELAVRQSPDTATRIEAALTSVSSDAVALGLSSIGDLARRGSEQALRLHNDPSARTALARTLRELGRAVEVLEKQRARGKVLIVDDSTLNAAVVVDALEGASFEAQHAEDGDAAVAAVARFSPDVVLADVHMPDSTPVELCARLRAAAGSRALHVILFSGLSDEELTELVRQTGANGFLSKDRGLDAVVKEIANACRSVAG